MSLAPVTFFFFQAEDGIRDVAVTGVQTCALPISIAPTRRSSTTAASSICATGRRTSGRRISRCSTASSRTRDRKSTRLNSSHGYISYAVFCLKKKKNTIQKQKELLNRGHREE